MKASLSEQVDDVIELKRCVLKIIKMIPLPSPRGLLAESGNEGLYVAKVRLCVLLLPRQQYKDAPAKLCNQIGCVTWTNSFRTLQDAENKV